MESFSDVTFDDHEFVWRLNRLGILFDSEEIVCKSRIFKSLNPFSKDKSNKEDSLKWQLVARCHRQCPSSMLRVYVSLKSLNDISIKGRYGIRSFFEPEFMKKKGPFNDGLYSDLGGVAENVNKEQAQENEDDTKVEDGHFIGWAGTITESVNKVVQLKIRIFHFFGDGFRIDTNSHSDVVRNSVTAYELGSTVVFLDAKMKNFVSFLYSKFVENVKEELKKRELEIVSMKRKFEISTQTEESEQLNPERDEKVLLPNVNWEEISRQILIRVLMLIAKKQNIFYQTKITMEADSRVAPEDCLQECLI